MATLYITPTGSGAGDGSSWANAATLSKLSTLIGKAGPGGEVLMRADLGAYNVTSPIIIRSGGADGAPVVVRGVDGLGHAMNAEILGTRNVAAGQAGAEVFRLMNGADNLTFEHMVFRNIGNGAFRIGADLHDLTIRHIDAFNVQRFLEDYVSGGNATATVTDLVVQDVEVHGYSKGVIRLQYNSNNILIEDVYGDSERQSQDDFAMGVLLDGATHNVLLRGVTMANNVNFTGSYWNGDGFVTERGVYAVRFENTRSIGNTDAGYDLKSRDTVLDNAYAEANKRNFRLWGEDITIVNSTGANPHKEGGSSSQAQVWIASGGKVTIIDSVFTDHDPNTVVWDLSDGGGSLTLSGVDVIKDAAAILQRLYAGSTISLAPDSGSAAPAMAVSSVTVAGVTLMGTTASDVINGGDGEDYLRGDAGNDRIIGGAGFDDINGNTGADTLSGGLGADWVAGGKDNDVLMGDEDNDIVYGNIGADTCDGGVGDDIVRGGQDNDSLTGGLGADWLSGDKGSDTISGGAGADIFHASSDAGLDRIVDFNRAEGDRVQLDAGATYTVAQSGADTVVSISGGAQVVLVGVQMSSLTSGWIFSA